MTASCHTLQGRHRNTSQFGECHKMICSSQVICHQQLLHLTFMTGVIPLQWEQREGAVQRLPGFQVCLHLHFWIRSCPPSVCIASSSAGICSWHPICAQWIPDPWCTIQLVIDKLWPNAATFLKRSAQKQNNLFCTIPRTTSCFKWLKFSTEVQHGHLHWLMLLAGCWAVLVITGDTTTNWIRVSTEYTQVKFKTFLNLNEIWDQTMECEITFCQNWCQERRKLDPRANTEAEKM